MAEPLCNDQKIRIVEMAAKLSIESALYSAKGVESTFTMLRDLVISGGKSPAAKAPGIWEEFITTSLPAKPEVIKADLNDLLFSDK